MWKFNYRKQAVCGLTTASVCFATGMHMTADERSYLIAVDVEAILIGVQFILHLKCVMFSMKKLPAYIFGNGGNLYRKGHADIREGKFFRIEGGVRERKGFLYEFGVNVCGCFGTADHNIV